MSKIGNYLIQRNYLNNKKSIISSIKKNIERWIKITDIFFTKEIRNKKKHPILSKSLTFLRSKLCHLAIKYQNPLFLIL